MLQICEMRLDCLAVASLKLLFTLTLTQYEGKHISALIIYKEQRASAIKCMSQIGEVLLYYRVMNILKLWFTLTLTHDNADYFLSTFLW